MLLALRRPDLQHGFASSPVADSVPELPHEGVLQIID
jgi:hypothetical protein